MDNRDLELLQAIQLIIDPLKDDMKDVKERLIHVENDLASVKEDISGVKEDISGVKEDISGVKEDISGVKEEVKRTSLIIENTIEPKLQALHDGYMPLAKKVRYVPEDIEDLKDRVSVLEFSHKIMADKIREGN